MWLLSGQLSENGTANGAFAHANGTVAAAPASTLTNREAGREAILYVPGLVGQADETATIVAKLSDALTVFGPDPTERYTFVEKPPSSGTPTDRVAPAFTIARNAPHGPVAVFDVFALDYASNVAGEYRSANTFVKALQLVLALHWLAPALVKTLLRGYRKTASQRRQLWYVLAILCGLAVYFGLTVLAIVQIVLLAFKGAVSTASGSHLPWTDLDARFAPFFPSLTFLMGAVPSVAQPTWPHPAATSFVRAAIGVLAYAQAWCAWALEWAYHGIIIVAGGWLLSQAPLFALVGTALGLSVPKLRSNFETVMNHLLAAIEYFRIGFARNKTTGQFHDLYGALCTAGYARVNVMAFSFGSLVALDSLFYTRGIAQGRIDRLGDLITIGAPITMAQTLWPKHFDVIRSSFTDPQRHTWINAQCGLDVIASPILDREDGKPVIEDRTMANWQDRQQPAWELFRRDEFRRQMQAAAADRGDPNNINFARAVNLDYSGWFPLDLDWAEFLSLAALRAHAMYWTPRGEVDYNAFDRIAPHLAARIGKAPVAAV